jgi:hypothetical protein
VAASPTSLRLEHIDGDAFEALVHAAGLTVPIEQAPVWEAFDASVPGRSPWGRLAVYADDGRPVAVMALSEYSGTGFRYLWAKHGPVWLETPTASAERDLRRGLTGFVATHAPRIAFVRLHMHHEAADLRPLLQTVTYDETVQVDLTPPTDDIMLAMGKTGRKKLRRTLRDEGFALSEERGISREDFGELYDIYRETADRDGFGIFPAEVYFSMLETLGDAARLFVARRVDDAGAEGRGGPGRAVSWVLSTFYDGVGQDYYGASNLEGLETNAALRLKWHILTSLKAEGGTRYDMMGVGSARAPQLMGVRQFKLQFADETTPVDPAWDLPVKRPTYALLVGMLRAKRLLRGRR